jgi:hypothetical protein
MHIADEPFSLNRCGSERVESAFRLAHIRCRDMNTRTLLPVRDGPVLFSFTPHETAKSLLITAADSDMPHPVVSQMKYFIPIVVLTVCLSNDDPLQHGTDTQKRLGTDKGLGCHHETVRKLPERE